MPDYRCNMLDQRGDVLFPADVVAEDLSTALQHAFDVLRQSNQGTPLSKRVYAIEVWAGEDKLFTRELGALADAMGDYTPKSESDMDGLGARLSPMGQLSGNACHR